MSRLIKNVSSKIAINVFYKSHIFYFFQHIKLQSHPLAHYQQSLLIQ